MGAAPKAEAWDLRGDRRGRTEVAEAGRVLRPLDCSFLVFLWFPRCGRQKAPRGVPGWTPTLKASPPAQAESLGVSGTFQGESKALGAGRPRRLLRVEGGTSGGQGGSPPTSCCV